MSILCTIEAGNLVALDTSETIGPARWWHHVLMTLSGAVSVWVSLDDLREKAPKYARELIQAPGAGV